MKKLFIVLIILIVVMAGLWFWASKQAPMVPQTYDTSEPVQTTRVSYACQAGKSIDATFMEGKPTVVINSDQPPVMSGAAQIRLSDGRTLDLKQTISADGVRYSNGDPSLKQGMPGAETFVFWSKGNGALVLENNVQKSYIGCVQAATDTTGALPKVYTDEAGTFSIRLPEGYTVDESYQYQVNPAVKVSGVKFTIPAALAKGTNLGSDSYVSVERIPNAKTCSASLFLDGSNPVSTQTDNGMTYSVSSAMNAGAGNRYEETVYAIPGSSPCTAVRYLIHWSVFENYPAGTIKQFDEAALKATFDQIRRSLVVNE